MLGQVDCKVHALFKFEVKKNGSTVRETPWIKNLVLDSGLDRMFQGTWFDRVVLGTGTTPPEVTDTQLENFLVFSNQRQINPAASIEPHGATFKVTQSVTWRFNEGEAEGTITEAGLGWNNVSLWNRVLIKDSQGNPKGLEVFEDEYLDVTTKVEFYLTSGVDSTINLLDKRGDVISTHDVKFKQPQFLTLSSLRLGSQLNNQYLFVSNGKVTNETTAISGTSLGIGATGVEQINLRSRLNKFKFSLTQANFKHKAFYFAITTWSVQHHWGFGFAFELDPPIEKTNNIELEHRLILNLGRYEG